MTIEEQPHEKPKLISINETCWLLGGIARSTLYTLFAQGKLKSVYIGSRHFVTLESINEMLRGGTHE